MIVISCDKIIWLSPVVKKSFFFSAFFLTDLNDYLSSPDELCGSRQFAVAAI